ncbi:MAG: adenylate/guanylate cyclase domain-containing protein [Chitinophagaceae bacterium]
MKLLILFLVAGFAANGQASPTRDTAAVNKLNEDSKSLAGSDSTKAISLAMQAKEIAAEIEYPKGEAYALKNLGLVYFYKAKYPETLDYWNPSLQIFEKIKDDVGISNMLSNIGAVYLTQGADTKALEYMLRSLQLAEKIGDTLRMYTALSNIGGIYYNKKDPVALNYLLKAIPLVERMDRKEDYVVITGNIGEIYSDKKDHQKALEYFEKSIKVAGNNISSAFAINGIGKVYLNEGKLTEALQFHNKALEIATKFDDKIQVARSMRGIADVYVKQNKTALAIEYYNKAKIIVEELDDLKIELKDLYHDMAFAYSKSKNYSNAFLYQSLYSDIKDTLYNIEAKKKLNQFQFDYELSKKEGELSRKQVELNLKEAKIKSEKQARIGVTIGLGLLLIIAFIIYRNSLQKSRINKILDKQKAQIELLLLNILPKEVATELQTSGNSKPRHFEEVSILFTDFKGFTSIADKLSPGELVEDLNECFIAFDSIIEKYNLEKIKTIGDSYMCAGNIPSPDPDHACKIIRAAMEIQEFMEQYNILRAEKGQEAWEIRIGANIGPVVAGVVGKKKYAYDVWGSSVNVASRMESNGTPGRVNISAYMYETIKDRFECSYRGKIYAKNVGDLDMYFVEYEKDQMAMPKIVGSNKEEPLLQQ